MSVTIRKVTRVGATSLLAPMDEGSGSLIVAREITPRQDNETDLHGGVSEYFEVCHGTIAWTKGHSPHKRGNRPR